MGASVLWVVVAALAFAALACAEKSSVLIHSSEHHHSRVGLLSLFDAWNAKHGKHYGPEHKVEKHKRFEVFRRNLMAIERHNSGDKSFRLGLNRFADLTNEEFRRMRRFGLKQNMAKLRKVKATASGNQEVLRKVSDVPAAVDWRAEGAVTAAKDQGMCGSCWAFSATGAIEGANAIATGSLVSVSEQELVTCDLGGMSEGCNGGLMDDAFEWVIRNGGIATEESYPYTSWTGDSGVCDMKLEGEEKTVTIDNYVDVESYNEDALLAAVAKQPVSVAIDGSAFDFQLYSEGIYNGTCSGDPYDTNHGVLLVGYGTENGVDYWIVKNSWSASWGEEGFIRMARNGSPYGICAILSMSSYPTKAAVSVDKAMISEM